MFEQWRSYNTHYVYYIKYSTLNIFVRYRFPFFEKERILDTLFIMKVIAFFIIHVKYLRRWFLLKCVRAQIFFVHPRHDILSGPSYFLFWSHNTQRTRTNATFNNANWLLMFEIINCIDFAVVFYWIRQMGWRFFEFFLNFQVNKKIL